MSPLPFLCPGAGDPGLGPKLGFLTCLNQAERKMVESSALRNSILTDSANSHSEVSLASRYCARAILLLSLSSRGIKH